MVGRWREGPTLHLRQVHLAQSVQQQRQAMPRYTAIDQQVRERHTAHTVHAKHALRGRIHHHRAAVTPSIPRTRSVRELHCGGCVE